MEIKCEKCGTTFYTNRCSCGKGVYWQQGLMRTRWVCNWCGSSRETEPSNFNCPKCGYYNGHGSGCYITTACVESKGLPDNCYELETIRKFRDSVMKTNEELLPIVEEYYHVAPSIVKKINEKQNHKEIYKYLYDNMILPCVKAIEEEKSEKAIDIYLSSYKKLCEDYIEH